MLCSPPASLRAYIPPLPPSARRGVDWTSSLIRPASSHPEDSVLVAVYVKMYEVVVLPVVLWSMVNVARSPWLYRLLSDPFVVLPEWPQEEPYPEEPYVLPPLKVGASAKLVMGLRRLQQGNWLTIDQNYLWEHQLRASLLREHGLGVLQCLPGSEMACEEVLSTVAAYLTTRHRNKFRCSGSQQRRVIQNLITGDEFPLINNPDPLRTAAELAMEDFNVLIKDANNGEYRLQASATLFPAGWKLEERIGSTMADLHRPVPGWNERLGRSVNQFFDRLTLEGTMERHTLFVQTTPDLFQDGGLCAPTSLSCPVTGLTMEDGRCGVNPHFGFSSTPEVTLAGTRSIPPDSSTKRLLPSDIYIRRERQTFNRLISSGAILFTVHTFMVPLSSLNDQDFAALMDVARRWDDDIAIYKGRESWWPTAQAHAVERAGRANFEPGTIMKA